MKNRIKKKIRKVGKTVIIVMLLVSLNINPIAMLSMVILDTGIVNKFSNLGKNLVYLAGQRIESVSATVPSISAPPYSTNPSISLDEPIDVNIVSTPDSYFSKTQDYLEWIRMYTSQLGNTEIDDSLYNIIYDLYKLGSGYSQSTKVEADSPSYRDYGKSLAVHDEAMTARLMGVNERDLTHINVAQIEQLKLLGYDPRWVNENGTLEEDMDKLIRATHKYSVANVYSLNNMIGGALWKPYSNEIPYIREFAEIVGGFANVYMGYWDTNVSTLKQPINTQRALEVLGYDAILRYEGIQVLEPTKILENGIEAIFVPDVEGLAKYVESPVQRDINTDPDTHDEDVPDRNLSVSGTGGVPTGQSGVNENIILRQVEVAEDGTKTYVPEDEIESAIIPDSTIVQLYQEEIPNEDITWLDAVTVLYKALDHEQISYQTFTAYNPNLTPETSPLSRELPGLTSFDGYNFYAFFTRANPYSGDLATGSFQAIYWRKAINDGFVSYALRDDAISAEDFYMLAQRMMTAYGEPEMSADEMHTLLQIYGSYYPVQLGRTVADAWEYLKCRGILTEDNEPESFTSNLTRDQLLDICMRIKDVDSRITYKNMNLTIDVGEVLRDKDYFPVYDFDLKTEDDDEFTFISTTVNYEAYDYYTYMFPIERSVTLGNSGCGLIYNKPEKSNENLINGALYEGKKHIEGYDYYVIDVPKEYTGQIFLGFQNYDDPGSVNGNVDFIEVPNYCLGGGIYTAYEKNEKDGKTIATLVKPELGVSYFPFSSQSNNMELVYYCDFKRCGVERPIGSESPSVASVWDKFVDMWEYLTQPTEVLAAEPEDDEDDEDDKSATLITNFSVNPDYWGPAIRTYGDATTIIDDDSENLITQLKPSAPGWVSVLTRSTLLANADLNVWDNISSEHIGISDAAEAVIATQQERREVSIGKNILDVNNSQHSSDLYKYLQDLEDKLVNRKKLVAFAAGIKPNQAWQLSDNIDKEDVNNSLTFMSQQKYGWVNEISCFNTVSGLSKYDTYDRNGFYTGTISEYTKAIKTDYQTLNSGAIFRIMSRGYTAEEICAKVGYANTYGNESGIMSSPSINVADIKTSLNTAVLMSKDEQILICWDDLVRTGYAWGIKDGKPSLNSDDATYTFMTKNGVVKVNDNLHLLQLGSTLYTWPHDNEAPNLIFTDDKSNMYIDIRCVTGVINIPVAEVGTKSYVTSASMGAGKYAVYSISAKDVSTSIYATRAISCYNFPETRETCGTGIASGTLFPTSMNALVSSVYDGEIMIGDNQYWFTPDKPDATLSANGDKSSMRVLLADFTPTSNWILTMTMDNGEASGKLYVYYLKDAFTTDSFVDGDSPPAPDPNGPWISYWKEYAEEQKKRCDINYSSMSYQVQEVMRQYRNSLPGEYDWIGDMTEAAMYSIAADTGYFYLSDDYAVRCFDLTESMLDTQPMYTDFTKNTVDAIGDNADFRTSDAGSVYFIDYAGYVYNLPNREDFTLSKYLSGVYPIPLVNVDDREIWNMNMTWYGNTPSGTKVPYGCELTSKGYISYKDGSTVIPESDLPKRSHIEFTETGNGSEEESTTVLNNTYSEERTDLPFYLPTGGENIVGDPSATFKPAPSGIFARYGNLYTTTDKTKVGSISQNETRRNYYYLGNRIVCISSDYASKNASMIPFDFGSKTYNPIALSSASEAHLVGQIRRPMSRNFYVLNTATVYRVDPAFINNSDKEHLATDDSYLWEGKPKLVAILNMIDKDTNWLMWAVFSLAPMICIIVMTILIGLSFITDNKIWLMFCEKCFDPVRFLTLGMKDSNSWKWQEVWKRATITYIAFALFANANILKIVIWFVDAWMRITEALGF